MRRSPDTGWRAKSRKRRRSSLCLTSVKWLCGEHRTCRAAISTWNTRPKTVSDSGAVPRILFEEFPTAEIRLFYVLGYGAIAIFFCGVYVQVRKYRRGAALRLDGSLWRRALDMTSAVLSHRTIDRRDRAAGGAHRLIFYGFTLLFVCTATITLP